MLTTIEIRDDIKQSFFITFFLYFDLVIFTYKMIENTFEYLTKQFYIRNDFHILILS